MDLSPTGPAGILASPRQQREELASTLTHAAGAAAAFVAGLILVVLVATRGGTPWQLAGALAFSLSMLLLYTASTLYHWTSNPARKARFKVLDHCAIYLLIAGTYTPFTLIALRGPWGSSLFAAIWTLALAGVVFKLFFTGRFKRLSTAIYVAMGWLVLVAIKPVLASLDTWTFAWLFAGGAAYTTGTVFYHRESLAYSHAIWHLFCIAGSACHFIAVSAQVLPT